jgi:putative ABC transport system permease protein
MRNWFADLHFGLRSLRRNAGFALGAILVLALGIGANTAIFSIVNAVLLRPLPYDHPSSLVMLFHVPPAKSFPGISLFALSPANFLDWQAQSTSFETMAIVGGNQLTLGGKDQPEVLNAAKVAPEFFSTLRVSPLLGRSFSPDENRPGSHVIVLGYKLWRDRFGSDPNIVGHDITLDSQRYNVVGVMPEKFVFPSFAKAWVPLAWTDQDRAVRGNHNYLAIGRLKPGVNLKQANAELASISARLEQLYPEDDKGWGGTAIPLHQQEVSDVRTALLVLLGAVGFVLLIACANVANLVLAKTLARQREIAIRTALGASRAAILRNILSETVLLAVIGGGLGLLLATVGVNTYVKIFAKYLPSFAEISLDPQVLTFTLVIAVLAGILAGLIPSLRFSRTDVNEALKSGQSRGASDSGGSKTRNLLIVSEVALSLVLLIGAGLMLRTLFGLHAVKTGFDANNVLTLSVAIGNDRFPTPAGEIGFFSDVLQGVRAVPGVQAAGTIDALPLSGNGGSHQPFSIQGRPVLPMAEQPEVDVRMISSGYLRAMHVPILRGRDFADSDVAGRPGVALISEALARHYFPNEDPIGKHIDLYFFPGVPREIVGIVGDTKLDSLDETRPTDTIYVALAQMTVSGDGIWRSFGETLAIRTSSDPHSVISAVTAAVHQVAPDVPVTDVLSMDDVITQSIAPQRSILSLLGAFAALALLLAAVGIYGVLSYAVRRRLREIGIRMALGASHTDVLKLVVVDGMKPILMGIAIGAAVALALSRLVVSLIFGVKPSDPLTFTCVALLLIIVGLAANTVPAFRATRVDPTRTLREE